MVKRELDKTKRETLTFEVRELVKSSVDNSVKVGGYAAVFDKPSEEMWGFVERIKPGAFKNTLGEKKSDPRLLWDHNSQYVLGRRSAGTLTLSEDAKGLAFEATLPDTSYARDLTVLIERGDVNQMSFGFNVIRDEWSDLDKPVSKRDLLEVRLIEVSIVGFPAYPQTSVGLRDQFPGLTEEDSAKVAEFLRSLHAPVAETAPDTPVAETVDPAWLRAIMDADMMMAGLPL